MAAPPIRDARAPRWTAGGRARAPSTDTRCEPDPARAGPRTPSCSSRIRCVSMLPTLRAPADAALRVHHPVPRHVARAAAASPADRAGRARPPEQRRDLPVRRHLPSRDPPHERGTPPRGTRFSAAPAARTAARTGARRARPARSSAACVPSSWIASAVQHEDPVGLLDRGQPMRDGERSCVPPASRAIAVRISASDSGSTLEVASSSTRTRDCTRARARWPAADAGRARD